MRVFDLPIILDQIEQAIEAGEDYSPLVNALVEMGPKAIDDWGFAIEEKRAMAEAAKTKAKEIAARGKAFGDRADKMEDILDGILKQHFSGKVKTAVGTYWSQKNTNYDFTVNFHDHPEFFKQPEPEVKKKDLIASYKAGTLPKDILVTEIESTSLRIRR